MVVREDMKRKTGDNSRGRDTMQVKYMCREGLPTAHDGSDSSCSEISKKSS